MKCKELQKVLVDSFETTKKVILNRKDKSATDRVSRRDFGSKSQLGDIRSVRNSSPFDIALSKLHDINQTD